MNIRLYDTKEEAMAVTAGSPIQIECVNDGVGDCPCKADLVLLERENGTHIAYVRHHPGCTGIEG